MKSSAFVICGKNIEDKSICEQHISCNANHQWI